MGTIQKLCLSFLWTALVNPASIRFLPLFCCGRKGLFPGTVMARADYCSVLSEGHLKSLKAFPLTDGDNLVCQLHGGNNIKHIGRCSDPFICEKLKMLKTGSAGQYDNTILLTGLQSR